jgi:hypothetical protein
VDVVEPPLSPLLFAGWGPGPAAPLGVVLALRPRAPGHRLLKVPDSYAGLRSPGGRAEVPTVTPPVRTKWVPELVRLTAAHE